MIFGWNPAVVRFFSSYLPGTGDKTYRFDDLGFVRDEEDKIVGTVDGWDPKLGGPNPVICFLPKGFQDDSSGA